MSTSHNITSLDASTPKTNNKRPRTRNGCLTCRIRKVKCDETLPICDKCSVGERSCTWPAILNAPYKKRRKKGTIEGDHTPHSSTLPVYSQNDPALHRSDTNGILPSTSNGQGDGESFSFNYGIVPDRTRAAMLMDPSFLHAYFPSLDERLIMRHYLSRTVHDILAYQSSKHPFNPWLSVHAPLIFAHLPGRSTFCDALRVAVLAVGAVHMRYSDNSADQQGAWRITRSAVPKVLNMITVGLNSITEGSEVGGPPRTVGSAEAELILAALLSCTLASSLAADDAWFDLLEAVFAFVARLGGAELLLRNSPRDRLSPARFVLEQLAIRDVFGCIGTGCSPAILGQAFTPWFFEAVRWSGVDLEWESVERTFGISRGMVDMMARISAVVSAVRHTGRRVLDHPARNSAQEADRMCSGPTSLDEVPTFHPVLRHFRLHLSKAAAYKRHETQESPRSLATQDYTEEYHWTEEKPPWDSRTRLNSSIGVESHLSAAAGLLMSELDMWSLASSLTPLHPRTQYGDHLYRHAMRIWLLRHVYGVAFDDEQITTAVLSIIELAVELVAHFGSINWLTWPIIIAGSHLEAGHAARETIIRLLNTFGPHACFDNNAASRMMLEFWRLHDLDPDRNVTYWDVASKLNCRPFLD